MKIVKIIQGTPEWLAHRSQHYNASDAPVVLGCSSYKTRNQLLHEIKTGITPEVDAATQYRFDKGHEFEALARELAEKEIGEILYPVVGTSGKYSASFDGLTMDYSIGFEHKTLNETLHSIVSFVGQELPLEYRVQMEHQMLVSSADKTLFMASKWDGETLIEERHCWYASSPETLSWVVLGWEQFEKDLANYTPVEVVEKAVATPTLGLPAVSIQVNGSIALIDNLEVFGNALTNYIAKLNKDPQTDQDFADLDGAVKTLKNAESALAAAESGALAQTASIDVMRKTVALYSEMARTSRLMFEKLVTKEKEARKQAVVQAGHSAMSAHVNALNDRLGKPYMPKQAGNFEAAIRGLKTIASIQNAVDTELAKAKIEANQVADRIQINLNVLREKAKDHMFLFADMPALALKANDDFDAAITTRISEHKINEASRIERDRLARNEAALNQPMAAAPAAPQSYQLPPASAVSVSGNIIDMQKRPTDEQIVMAVARAFGIQKMQAVEWLTDLDFDALTDDLVATN